MNKKLSDQLNSFPKDYQLNQETKLKIEFVLQEEIIKIEKKAKWRGFKDILKKLAIPVSGVTVMAIVALLLFSSQNFDLFQWALDGNSSNIKTEVGTVEDIQKVEELSTVWANALKTRDGKPRYEMMSEKAKEKFVQEQIIRSGEDWNYNIGVSSPWVVNYEIEIDGLKAIITYTTQTSIPEFYHTQEMLTFKRENKEWFVDDYQTIFEDQLIGAEEDAGQTFVSLVEEFGRRLKNVSLLGPQEELEKSMEENYGGIISPELLTQWLKDPQNALGRLTSSPWPDRIDITMTQEQSEQKYLVKGDIVEVTSTGVADQRPIQLLVEKVGEQWLIIDVENLQGDNEDSLVYGNAEYSFHFKLPVSWKDYSIIEDEWIGEADGEVIEKGPMLSIRHPEWTSEQPRQDIPIMIFTLEQWEAMQSENFHIGAAPTGPKELARNEEYVFALPARYNFAFPAGYEEVEEILEQNPLEVQF